MAELTVVKGAGVIGKSVFSSSFFFKKIKHPSDILNECFNVLPCCLDFGFDHIS